MQEIEIPETLNPLVKAFSADEKSAKLLIMEAAKTIGKAAKKGYSFDDQDVTKDELEGIIALMKGIAPKDTIEMIYGAQIIASHITGLRLLRHDFPADQALGLRLLRFSNEAMIQLQKKKAGTPPSAIIIVSKDQTCQ